MVTISEKKFYDVLENIFMGARIEGISGFINLMQIKSNYYNAVFTDIKKETENKLQKFPKFEEEFYDKLYGFFSRYFNENGSIFYVSTPFREKIFEQVYSDSKDVTLFWKSNMLYYVKTDIIPKEIKITLDNFNFVFSVSNLKHKGTWEKKNFVFELDNVKDKNITIKVIYSENGKKTKIDEIQKQFKEKKIKIESELLERAFNIFEMQVKIDYFINKKPKEFLTEQFSLFLYRYTFSDMNDFTSDRLNQIQFLKETALKIINFISQFEEEIGKIWNKPKFVFDVNYVITLNKFESNIGVLKELIKDKNWKNQLEEWSALKLIEKTQKIEIIKNDKINPEFKFLPLDTRHFRHNKTKILSIFENIDEEVDGFLIKSENYQALKTILPKFENKVQTIYIDPPFNKENEADYHYSVKFKDSTWITMLENRINLAREFLKKEGSMFVRCDYNGNMYARLLLNEIFTPSQFRNEIVVSRGKQQLGNSGRYTVATDSLFHYSKINDQTETDSLYYYSKSDTYYFSKFSRPRTIDEASGTNMVMKYERHPRERVFYDDSKTYVLLPPPDNHFKFIQKILEEMHDKGIVELHPAKKGLESGYQVFVPEEDLKKEKIKIVLELPTTFTKNGLLYVSVKGKLDESGLYRNIGTKENPTWKRIKGKWEKFDKSPWYRFDTEYSVNSNWTDISGYSGNWDFVTENSEDLLKRVIKTSSQEKDLVLDFFLGSGTTIATAHKLGRKWIGIEMGAHFESHVLPRMKHVLAGEQSGISKDVKWKGGGCFKFYELEQYEDSLQKISYKEADPLFIGTEEKYNQYIFMKDEKMLNGLEIDYKQKKIIVKLETLYHNIDIPETISNLHGKMIKSVNDEVIFTDGTKININDLDYKQIKPLIWW